MTEKHDHPTAEQLGRLVEDLAQREKSRGVDTLSDAEREEALRKSGIDRQAAQAIGDRVHARMLDAEAARRAPPEACAPTDMPKRKRLSPGELLYKLEHWEESLSLDERMEYFLSMTPEEIDRELEAAGFDPSEHDAFVDEVLRAPGGNVAEAMAEWRRKRGSAG